MEKKKSYDTDGVVTKIILNIMTQNAVKTFELEWDAMKIWTKTRPATGHAHASGLNHLFD
jgi:hypothetical protein